LPPLDMQTTIQRNGSRSWEPLAAGDPSGKEMRHHDVLAPASSVLHVWAGRFLLCDRRAGCCFPSSQRSQAPGEFGAPLHCDDCKLNVHSVNISGPVTVLLVRNACCAFPDPGGLRGVQAPGGTIHG
jgi:hypothetical protein